MKNAIACLASLLALTALAADKPVTEGATPGQWTMDFEAAKKVAAEKKLPILINFTGSDWCGWCKHMDKEVFSQDAWRSYAKENLMLVWIDFPHDPSLVPEKYVARNKALSDQFGVEGYPAYLILDDDGKKQLGQLGADQEITPTLFITRLKGVMKNRSAEVDKLLSTLPEKVAQDYRATAKKLEDSRTELKASEETYKKKTAELQALIAATDKRLDAIRIDAFLAKLPKEKAADYTAKKAQHDKVNAELEAWIATRPERNDANTKKYSAWREELATLEAGMQKVLDQ